MTIIKTTDLYNKIVQIANDNPTELYRERSRRLFGDNGSGAFAGETFCNYVIEDQAACIVGVALNELGMSIDRLKELDNRYGAIGTVLVSLDGGEIECDGMEIEIRKAQLWQDKGMPWGECIEGTV